MIGRSLLIEVLRQVLLHRSKDFGKLRLLRRRQYSVNL